MVLEQNKKYFINFVPEGRELLDLAYQGYGMYTGKQMIDKDDTILMWFEDLDKKLGFTENGWFSITDINL